MRPSCCSHCCSDAALLSRGGKLPTLCDAARCALYPGRRGCRQRSDGLEGDGAQSIRARRPWPLLPPSLRSVETRREHCRECIAPTARHTRLPFRIPSRQRASLDRVYSSRSVPRTESTELSSWATAGRSSAAVRAPQSTPFATCYDSTTTRSTASRGTSAAGPRCGSSRTGRAPQPLALDPPVAPSALSRLESALVSSFEPASLQPPCASSPPHTGAWSCCASTRTVGRRRRTAARGCLSSSPSRTSSSESSTIRGIVLTEAAHGCSTHRSHTRTEPRTLNAVGGLYGRGDAG